MTVLRRLVPVMVASLAFAPAVWAVEPLANTPPGPAMEGNANSMLSQSDRDFLFNDARGAAFERELAGIAVRKSVDPRVKQLARMIVEDHILYNSTLTEIGENNGLTLPTAPSDQDGFLLNKIAAMSGKDFDTAFVKAMVDVNQQDLQEAAKEDSTTWSPLIHDFIVQFKPMDEKHLHDAQALQSS